MAFKRKQHKRKRSWPKRKRVVRTKKFLRRGRSQKSNIATSTETLDLGTFAMTTDSKSTAANLSTIQLSAFARTTAVAYNYRFYRITKVTFDYMPEMNTFQAGTGSAETIPRMISVMCRDGNFNGSSATSAGTVGDLEEMGGKFRPFLKPIKISYAPNICLLTGGLDTGGNPAVAPSTAPAVYVTRKKSPWLSTIRENTNVTAPDPLTPGLSWIHFGHQWAVVADQFGSGAIAGSLKVTIHTEFKLPLAAPATV